MQPNRARAKTLAKALALLGFTEPQAALWSPLAEGVRSPSPFIGTLSGDGDRPG